MYKLTNTHLLTYSPFMSQIKATVPETVCRSQLDLVVGIGQINLYKAVSTSQVSHEVLRKWYGLVMVSSWGLIVTE